MAGEEIKIKSSELNGLYLKLLTVITGSLVAVLIWLGQGLYAAQQKTTEATIIMGSHMDSITKDIAAVQKKLDGTMDKREFDIEVSGLKVRMSSIEVRQSSLDLEIQRNRKP